MTSLLNNADPTRTHSISVAIHQTVPTKYNINISSNKQILYERRKNYLYNYFALQKSHRKMEAKNLSFKICSKWTNLILPKGGHYWTYSNYWKLFS